VLAFGAGSPKLETAERTIAAMTDPFALTDLTEGYIALAPAAYVNGKPRQTTGAAPSATAEDGSDAADLYTKIRAEGASANGTAPAGKGN
jgi:hypothetical protein